MKKCSVISLGGGGKEKSKLLRMTWNTFWVWNFWNLMKSSMWPQATNQPHNCQTVLARRQVAPLVEAARLEKKTLKWKWIPKEEQDICYGRLAETLQSLAAQTEKRAWITKKFSRFSSQLAPWYFYDLGLAAKYMITKLLHFSKNDWITLMRQIVPSGLEFNTKVLG